MQPHLQHVNSYQPRVFRYSLDWRFLLPISDPAKITVVLENEADFSETLDQIGVPVSNQLSFANFKQGDRNSTQSCVLPFGLPVRWVSTQQDEQIEFCRSIRRLINPDGYLLIGFNNFWNPRSHAQPRYHSSTARRVAYQLNRAGFKSIKIFGAMPNLCIPEYIFDLNAQAIHFTLRHRFRRKPVMVNALQMLSHTIGLDYISSFLPCYFAVATV